ncbi:unnamed protein product [Cladocopium goreaui]|uniref:Polyribonucleotide 5'-hydroxyl-kinase Clp1 (Polyadenylation factor Clp1) (Polynucleotide kinase Clp1) (Pre-mRNA cleavage complex II protein Clp1) n=1 Tax=Cladocopium goreaui TaxID=2562237 RepID=A0A9P1CXH8_9DINO|nr:unnamed protein product [Cladocopium goreaui]
MALALGMPQAFAPPGQDQLQMAMDPTAPRVKVISPGCELRLIVDDDKHARVKLIPQQFPTSRPGQPAEASAEIFGAEMVAGQDYPLLGGTRTAIFSWHGCKVQVSGPTVQEYDAPNVVMRDYLCCAAVLEQRRMRADDLGLPAPRVLVCGNAFSGKSALCQILCNYALRRVCLAKCSVVRKILLLLVTDCGQTQQSSMMFPDPLCAGCIAGVAMNLSKFLHI